jgi:hypothetical protein
MEYLTQIDKVKITVDIANKLRNFEGPNGKVNLFNEEYSFIKELKTIFNDYIHSDKQFKGTLQFLEINKTIDYCLPNTNKRQPLFVIRI